MKQVHQRNMTTICLQTNCHQCCTNTNMLLSRKDIENIQHLGYETRFFLRKKDGWYQLRNTKGRCVFHNGTCCQIYTHRPEGCRLYPIVYNTDDRCAILDEECPQKHTFTFSKTRKQQLTRLISTLKHEREERKTQTKKRI